MQFDYSALKIKIAEMHQTQDRFACALGIPETSLSQKLSGIADFSQEEMLKACTLLNLKAEDIGKYFFTEASK